MVSYAIHYLDFFIGKFTGIAELPFPVHLFCGVPDMLCNGPWIVDELILDHRVYKREGRVGVDGNVSSIICHIKKAYNAEAYFHTE